MSPRAPLRASRHEEAAAAVQARASVAQVRSVADALAEDAVTLREFTDPALYTNRELSWLDFNDRVLQLAEDESLPLLERVKFMAIFVTNLDEFFMIRVAGVHDQVDARIDARGPDGLSPIEALQQIAEKVTVLDARHSRQFNKVISPELAANGDRKSVV